MAEGPSQATLLVELATDVDLSRPPGRRRTPIESGGHREIWPLRTKPSRPGGRRYYQFVRGAPGSQALPGALAVLEGSLSKGRCTTSASASP